MPEQEPTSDTTHFQRRGLRPLAPAGVESNVDEKGSTIIYYEDGKLHERGLDVC
jgi:hypothetical protein